MSGTAVGGRRPLAAAHDEGIPPQCGHPPTPEDALPGDVLPRALRRAGIGSDLSHYGALRRCSPGHLLRHSATGSDRMVGIPSQSEFGRHGPCPRVPSTRHSGRPVPVSVPGRLVLPRARAQTRSARTTTAATAAIAPASTLSVRQIVKPPAATQTTANSQLRPWRTSSRLSTETGACSWGIWSPSFPRRRLTGTTNAPLSFEHRVSHRSVGALSPVRPRDWRYRDVIGDAATPPPNDRPATDPAKGLRGGRTDASRSAPRRGPCQAAAAPPPDHELSPATCDCATNATRSPVGSASSRSHQRPQTDMALADHSAGHAATSPRM